MVNALLLVRAAGALALPVLAIGGAGSRRGRGRTTPGTPTPVEDEPVTTSVEEPQNDKETSGLERRPATAPAGPRPGRRELRKLRQAPELLREVDLRRADLQGWSLAGVDLSGVDLSHARLRRADLQNASLANARLDYADLSGTNLRGADLSGVAFLETDLGGADLRGVDLRGARQLPMANLRGTKTDQTTKWPPGFDPQRAMTPRL